MFTFKEMTNALVRMQSAGELPALVCIAIDKEDQITGSAAPQLGNISNEDLPRVCYNMTKFLIEEDDGKKKVAKKVKAFRDYMVKKFQKHMWKETDLGKKFRKEKFPRYYVSDFRIIPASQIVDTKVNTEFKDQVGLMVTMTKGPKK